MSEPSLRDQAVAAVAHYLNGSRYECENHLYLAAADLIDGLNRAELMQRGIDLEDA